MKKVSVVIPVYNVEEHVADCLKSLLNQTHHNIEMLCIDDCSTDDSLEIVKTISSKDDRIKVISHEENKGLGGARNTVPRARSSPSMGFSSVCSKSACSVVRARYARSARPSAAAAS